MTSGLMNKAVNMVDLCKTDDPILRKHKCTIKIPSARRTDISLVIAYLMKT